jgi:hypothetical protein
MDFSSPQAVAAIVAGVVALVTATVTAAVTAIVTLRAVERRALVDEKLAVLRGDIDRELAQTKARLDNRSVFAAERVVHELMRTRWRLRSFDVIKSHIGGYDKEEHQDELRKVLVGAGGIRFKSKSGYELWGLLERNQDLLGAYQVPWDPETEILKIPLADRAGLGLPGRS